MSTAKSNAKPIVAHILGIIKAMPFMSPPPTKPYSTDRYKGSRTNRMSVTYYAKARAYLLLTAHIRSRSSTSSQATTSVATAPAKQNSPICCDVICSA